MDGGNEYGWMKHEWMGEGIEHGWKERGWMDGLWMSSAIYPELIMKFCIRSIEKESI